MLGMVHHQPREEFHSKDKNMMLADIKTSLAGYVAEKLKSGSTTSGVSADFRHAMAIAHNMVWVYGMGDKNYLGDYTVIPEAQLSEDVKQELNAETNTIIQRCVKEVEDLLTKERPLLDRFTKELLEKEELDYDDIDAIFREYGKESAAGREKPKWAGK
jgi:cell division protease FtsH